MTLTGKISIRTKTLFIILFVVLIHAVVAFAAVGLVSKIYRETNSDTEKSTEPTPDRIESALPE